MVLKIGNAQAFWGDFPAAPAQLLSQEKNLDFLTLDYLAEVSLSIMAIQREKDPKLGFAQDFIEVIKSIIPFWQQGHQVKIVANAGGLNPIGCAEACREILEMYGCKKKIGVVYGDNVFSTLFEDTTVKNLENGQALSTISNKFVTANAYLGAAPIAEALKKGAEIVITGRVADPSLTVGPCLAHFNWKLDDYDRLAQATIAGHLIECGTQVTGGMSTNWLSIPGKTHIGFPIVKMNEDGTFVITKPVGTGGAVTEETVKEQLLYEIGDPNHYLSPDVTVSFLSISLKEIAQDQIQITGAKGNPPPSTYKVSGTYRDGFRAEAMLGIFGSYVKEKARLCAESVFEHVRECGFKIERTHWECLGSGAIVPGVFDFPSSECVLRIAVADQHYEALECFSKAIASLVTCGPQGVVGYTSGRPKIRPVFGYWPCLIDRRKVQPIVQIIDLLPTNDTKEL